MLHVWACVKILASSSDIVKQGLIQAYSVSNHSFTSEGFPQANFPQHVTARATYKWLPWAVDCVLVENSVGRLVGRRSGEHTLFYRSPEPRQGASTHCGAHNDAAGGGLC